MIEETLERLRKERLADDSQFARVWVENRNTFRPRSRRALSMELRQKGIAEDAIQSALQGVDEESLAYEAARKRVNRLQGLTWDEYRKKLSEYLARRGFPYVIIASTVGRLWNETHAGQEQSMDDEESL